MWLNILAVASAFVSMMIVVGIASYLTPQNDKTDEEWADEQW